MIKAEHSVPHAWRKRFFIYVAVHTNFDSDARVITTAQLHSSESEDRCSADSTPARGISDAGIHVLLVPVRS